MVASTIEKEDSDKSISDPSVLNMDTLHTHRLETLLIFSYLLHAQLVLDTPDKHWPGDIEIEIPLVVLKPILLFTGDLVNDSLLALPARSSLTWCRRW